MLPHIFPGPVTGGWHDGYTNANLRMSSSLPNCRAIIGPWSHNWPDEAVPGPNINFMGECLSFWDKHLKGKATGAQEKGRVRWFMCQGIVAPGMLGTTITQKS